MRFQNAWISWTSGIIEVAARTAPDAAGDIRDARTAGVRSVVVTRGWHSRERLLAAQPDFLVETPEGLLKV